MSDGCSRESGVALSMLQFIALTAVFASYTDKRPLFVYTSSLSHHDAMLSANISNVTFFYNFDDYRLQAAVNPITPHRHVVLNNPNSSIHLMVVVTFFLFMLPSLLCVLFAFTTIRMIEQGVLAEGVPYGEHALRDSLGWELVFWCFVVIQHFLVQVVMSSPVELMLAWAVAGYIAMLLCLSILCMMQLGASDEPHEASLGRRVEAPVFILLCVFYFIAVSHSKVVLSRQFTYVAWMLQILLDCLLLFGHTWDSRCFCDTVANCRWTYVLMCATFNVGLYIAF